MKIKTLVLCALLAGSAAMARAQAQGSFTNKCTTPPVEQQIPNAGLIATLTCTTTAQINGVAFKVLALSVYATRVATEGNNYGVMVGTLANGDQVFFKYHTVIPIKNGVVGQGTKTYQITGGTGTAAGISGSGTCKIANIATATTGDQENCTGSYSLHSAATGNVMH